MRYIDTLRDGMRVSDVYLCKSKTIALTKTGKEYGNVILQDKTGQIESKIWDLHNPGIDEFEPMDYVQVDGNVTVFNNANQLNIQRIRRAEAGQYAPEDYFPVSEKNISEMYLKLKKLVSGISDPYLQKLLHLFFVEDTAFIKTFCAHSAAKSVHHGFIGGLLEHTLSVAELCSLCASHYPFVSRDLVITGALLHDIGKTVELSEFPSNDYTDEGQLLGHIMIGAQMVSDRIKTIPGFPKKLRSEVIHLILSHHGELEFGSPKKPALMEALILSFADNMDAKVETMHEALLSKQPLNQDGWLGFNRLLDTNIRKTSI